MPNDQGELVVRDVIKDLDLRSVNEFFLGQCLREELLTLDFWTRITFRHRGGGKNGGRRVHTKIILIGGDQLYHAGR